MSHSYKLTYFDGKGRAEVTRLLFALAGKEFEDELLDDKQWKEKKDTFPMSQLPALQIDGCKNLLSQSGTIARFVACDLGLLGSNKFEHACCDMFLEAMNDIITSFYKSAFNGDNEEAKKKLKEDAAKAGCGFAKMVKDNKHGKFMLGDKPTAADLAIFSAVEFMENMCAGSSKKHESLCEIFTAVSECPKIANYLKTRKERPF